MGIFPSCGGFCSHHILNPLKHLCFVLHWCFKQCFPSHHQSTRSGDIFWTSGVNPGSWAPETCQIPLKIVEVSCALSHGLGNLHWFFFKFLTHLKVMKFSWTKLISEKMCLNVCILQVLLCSNASVLTDNLKIWNVPRGQPNAFADFKCKCFLYMHLC